MVGLIKNTGVWLLVSILIVAFSHAQSALQYQNRGNRYEGIKPRPVSGYDIELISVLVDYREDYQQMPGRLKIRFPLSRSAQVSVTVRERNYKHYYWMDKIEPARPWRQGFTNVFEWSTEDVIQKIEGLDIYDLGVVARLGKPVPSKVEEVAPVILYHTEAPPVIKGYLFTLKTGSDSRLVCRVYREGESKPVFEQSFARERGGRAFTVRWDCTGSPRGRYKMVVTGYTLDTNDPIDLTVYFYHQPSVK